MARILTWLVLPIVMLVACLPSAAQANSDETTLLSLELQWVQAAARRDTAALRRILADGFTDTTYQGRLRTKADHLAAPAVRDASEKLEDMKVQLYGDTAVVTGRNVVTANDHSFVMYIRFTDVFLKRRDRWQAIAAQETQEQPNKPAGENH